MRKPPNKLAESNQRTLNWRAIIRLGEAIVENPDIESAIIEQISELFVSKVELLLLKTDSSANRKNRVANRLLQKSLRYKKTVYLDSNHIPKIYHASTFSKSGASQRISNQIATPIIFQESIKGVIQLSRQENDFFSPSEIDFLVSLVAQISMSLKIREQIEKVDNQSKNLELIHIASDLFKNHPNINEFSKSVCYLVQSTFNFEYVGVYSWDPSSRKITLVNKASNAAAINNPLEFQRTLADNKNIISCAVLGIEITESLDRSKSPDQSRLAHSEGEIALPLLLDGKVFGVFFIYFSSFDNQLENQVTLRSIANLLASALENARRQHDVTKRISLLEFASKVSYAMTSILDESEFFEKVTSALHDQFNYAFVQLFSVHTGRKKVFFRSGETHLDRPTLPIGFAYDLEADGAVSFSARTGKVIYDFPKSNMDISGSPFDLNSSPKSIIVVPLKCADQVLGVMEIGSNSESGFINDDQSLLEAIAEYIGIAMFNTSMYHSEHWRRKVAESMREIAGLLTANTDSKQMLQLILRQLEITLPIDIAAIWLLENFRQEKEESKPTLQLAAVHLSESFNQDNTNNENRFNADEILQYCQDASLPSPWLLQALEKSDSLIRTKDDPYEPLGAILDFESDYSAIAAPLRIGNEVIGLLTLAHNTSNRYGYETQMMTTTFASYAAVAIENARLYEAAHDQAWISTILLQVAEATQSLNSLEDLLATMAQLSATLIGLDSCMIFLWDNFRELFVPVKNFGLDKEQTLMFENWWIALGDIPAVDQMYFSKQPIYITPDQTNDHPLALTIQKTLNSPEHSLVIFPMVTRGDIIGFFMVTFCDSEASNHPTRMSPDIEWEEKYAITQGIAQQTAVAVENLQLLKSQQEEAYISVALLQVAQAVVSINALAETLETIVRLTPILIGVRRCAIFLWNENDYMYRLAGYYGLSRSDIEEMGNEFLQNEFPLLDTVRNSAQLAIHIIRSETENPIDWQIISDEEIFLSTIDASQNTEDIQESVDLAPNLAHGFLHSSSSLMFGFPLAVKGKVLGVMLTQEMDHAVAHFQGRSKRHEIASGIAHQVALAIQNDQLQNEVLERERLEREFQLAREIQETFLPDHLPLLNGWDLKALWQPARQVSGDFYDILELPGNQLGIVIADVADKGMPAALIMTLVRTLIRAAVREQESPAIVLNRVNDLLIPDAKHGMFVTVTYFLIDLTSGMVRYANAGHNPPLLLKISSGSFERLTRTGIALGIFENAEIGERTLILEKGEKIIFYTDGITESFSPTEEMYGEGRLINLLLEMGNDPLKNALDKVLASVTNFIGSANYSDDITLVGVFRE